MTSPADVRDSVVYSVSVVHDAQPSTLTSLRFDAGDFLFDHVMRRSMVCFETAVNPFVKHHLKIAFPERY